MRSLVDLAQISQNFAFSWDLWEISQADLFSLSSPQLNRVLLYERESKCQYSQTIFVGAWIYRIKPILPKIPLSKKSIPKNAVFFRARKNSRFSCGKLIQSNPIQYRILVFKLLFYCHHKLVAFSQNVASVILHFYRWPFSAHYPFRWHFIWLYWVHCGRLLLNLRN